MRRLSLISLILLLFSGFGIGQAQNQLILPSVGFCGGFGEAPTPEDYGNPQIPVRFIGSIFDVDCTLQSTEQELSQWYRKAPYFSVNRQNIQGYRGLVIDTLSPHPPDTDPNTIYNARYRGIYLFDKKQLIGYHLMTNTSAGYCCENDPYMLKIKALPKQVLTEAPGGIPVPQGLIVEEYDASTATHIEKFLFVRSSEIQQILTHSFYPRPLQAQMDEMMADNIFQNLREIHKRWAD